jgi:membrane fusion protein, multidrug efflux system
MKNYLIIIVALLTAVLFTAGCTEEKVESKSMEQIRQEEGTPVKIESVNYKKFEKELTFYARLSGIKEAVKGALVGGRIENIKASVGSRVSKDQVIVEFDENNPAAQYRQAKTAFENSEKTYQRMKKLLEAGETAQAAFDGAEAQYLVNKRNYESVRQMLFIESPFDGTIIDIKVNEGDNVKNEAHLFTVAVLNKMRAKIWASEKEISLMKKGMPAVMELGGKTYRGRIVEISLGQDPYKQAFYAEVEFDNSSNELRSGVTAEIKIQVYNNPKAIIIPRNLVKKDNEGMFVFIENDGIAEKKYITNGIESGLEYEVSSGLNAGDKIIVQGASYLDNGSKVKVIL